jgi:hypothetical protein
VLFENRDDLRLGESRLTHRASFRPFWPGNPQFYLARLSGATSDWKYRHLIDLVRSPPKARAGNGSRIAYRFTTLSRCELTPYHASFYGGGVKSIPALELTPLALAVWFMDDGSKSYRTVYLNTQQFDVQSQERMKSQLLSQFGIRVTLNRDKTYYRLRMAVESVSRFRRIIEPHLLEEFAYKLPA